MSRPLSVEFDDAFYHVTARTAAIAQAYQCGGYTMADIARYFGVHRVTVGKIMTKRAADKRKD